MESSGPVDQSIVFLIHGDADYSYHDSDGTAYIADEVAIAQARRVAMRNPEAEVFIFHERPLKRRFFLFPRDDGTFYYFRRGVLKVKKTYRRGHGNSRLGEVVTTYHSYRSRQHTPALRLLVYMGHEIPEMQDIRYDASRRRGVFGIDHFAKALGSMTNDAAPFDLLVLSTCYGGTPYSIRSLIPYARTIVGSPGYLHLSHLDLDVLERLDEHPDRSARAIADDLARASFQRLSADLQTGVTVAVYDANRVKSYVDRVAGSYDSTLVQLKNVHPARQEFIDCSEIETFVRPDMSDGVEIHYRAPRFGRRADRVSHSGWQCRQEVNR